MMRPDLEFTMLLDPRCRPSKVLTVACMETYNMDDALMDHGERIQMSEKICSKLVDEPMEATRPKHLSFQKLCVTDEWSKT